MPVPYGANGLAVNTVTNKVYIANRVSTGSAAGFVTVLDGATNTWVTVTDPKVLTRRQGWGVDPKRVYRLYREEGLAVRRLKGSACCAPRLLLYR